MDKDWYTDITVTRKKDILSLICPRLAYSVKGIIDNLALMLYL